jgi:hypothetical protein
MLIYRFRVTSDELEGFLREIEIQPNQSFLDFHAVMMEAVDLHHCERASFFMTDKKYKKDKEVSLKPEKREVRKYDEDLDRVVTETVTLPLMKSLKIKDYIEDPHQRLLYEFTSKEYHSFFIELFKIFPSDNMNSYPRCNKRQGELPKKPDIPVPLAPSTPAAPKVVIPKIQLPKPDLAAKLDSIVEDESEIAEIENSLGDLLVVDQDLELGAEAEAESESESDTDHVDIPPSVASDGDEYSDGEDDHRMEHLEDYEDIESLDKRYSGFDRDSDDY